MNTLEAIRSRRSIRKFKDQKVDHAVIEDIIADAAFAPSWKNTQCARYHITEDRAVMEKIASEYALGFAYNTGTIAKAPQLVVLTAIRGRSGMEKDGSATTDKGESWLMFDAGIAAQTFCLAANEKGLGTCIMGIFDDAAVAEAISLPEGQKVGALIAIGYPAEEPAAPARKEVEQLVQFL